MTTFNQITDTTDFTPAELRIFQMLQNDGPVAEWKWECACVWCRDNIISDELSDEEMREAWTSYMSANLPVEDVPEVDPFFDSEGMMWEVIYDLNGSVTMGEWQEAVAWMLLQDADDVSESEDLKRLWAERVS